MDNSEYLFDRTPPRLTAHRRATGAVVGLLLGALWVTSCSPALADSRSQSLYAKGLVPFHNGRWDEAYQLFDQAVKADPDDALALYYRGLTAARRGQPSVAIPDLERAAQLRPNLTHLALDLGITYFDAGQYADATRWLEQAYATAADRFPAAFFLGLTHDRLGDVAKASRYLSEAEKDPELRPMASYYSGLLQLREGREAEGRASLEQAARGRPDSETARAAQQYLAGAAEVRRPPEPGAPVDTKPWSIYGDGRFEYDSNVVLAPSDSSVSGSQTDEADGRVVLGFGGQYRLIKSQSGEISASYDLSQSVHFQLNEFDLQGHRVRLQAVTSPGPVQFGFASTYSFYLLDYESFFQEVLVTPWVTIPEGDAAATQVYYTFRGRDFFRSPFDPGRDSGNDAFGIRQYGLLGSDDRLFSIGYQFDNEDTVANLVNGRRNDFEYQGHQFDLGVQVPVLDLATAQLSYLFRLEDYQFPNSRTATPTSAGVRRHDDQHEFVLAFYRDLNEYLQVSLAYLGVVNNSNVETFDYDRNIVSVGVRAHY
jgi:thioredoxin-like negative regulator of GroEL